MELPNWEFEASKSNANIEGPMVTGVLPHWDENQFTLELEVEGYPEYHSSYTFLYSPNN